MADAGDLRDENARLKAQLAELQHQREEERRQYEAKVQAEREHGKHHADSVNQRTSELEAMKQSVVKLTRQLDEEVSRSSQAQAETQALERRVADISSGNPQAPGGASPRPPGAKGRHARSSDEDEIAARERGSQVSSKLMRVVDQWMRHRDLPQALLRGASINDQAFITLVQALGDCSSLQTVDLSQNLLTMDSCSDLCQLITSSPQLSFISLSDNLLSLRSVGYFMTAVMERQSTKKLMPLDLLDLSGNEGLSAAARAPAPDALLRQVNGALSRDGSRLPPGGPELVAQVMRALWRFLHDTGHPQVRSASPEEINFGAMEKVTLRKMENALSKIMLLGTEEPGLRPVTANLALLSALDSDLAQLARPGGAAGADSPPGASMGAAGGPGGASPSGPRPSAYASPPRGGGARGGGYGPGSAAPGSAMARDLPESMSPDKRPELRDAFHDLKAAFEPAHAKLKTFNLKQIVTRSGQVLIGMLERLLETTEIDAIDVETEQTLLEYACTTGNMNLAKLCYRRGAKLSAKTRKGDTPFNIVTKNRRYDMMEFLHLYGVKVDSSDKDGRAALHCAANNDDTDGICRLMEWGADVNIRDSMQRTPIHIAAAAGNTKAVLLLLEVGADMNAKDNKLYTAAAHANFNSHFELFDRLALLGGRRHGQIAQSNKGQSVKTLGELNIGAGMLKSSSLGRIGKLTVAGMPGPLQPTLFDKK